ncbi:DUF1003 domain-containing protein [Candidatus Kaiserbacteria bacterium]|nr:DUF1003 domain-containing protein [Candidatus Kaiserbacteria bacterium]
MTLNWHQKDEKNRSTGDRIADTIADFVGSWPFVIIHILWFSAWILLDIETFPYGFLTMVVSLEAIFLTTLVLMSQNRQEESDRTQAEADYETNVKAEEEIEELQIRLARVEDEKLEKILRLLETIKNV